MEFYRAQVEEIARKICQEMHLAVYDIEEKMSGKGRIITVYLALGKELEIFDLIPERYFLEVSSPGLERPLKLKSHYVSAINEKVAVQFQAGEERKSIMGTLTEVNQDTIVIDDRGSVTEIPFKSIIRAKTVFLAIPKRRD